MYCNTIELYCEKRARQGWTVLQYNAQPSHDTTTVAATRHAGAGLGAQEGAGGRWAHGWACVGRWAGRAGRRRQARGRTRACWARRLQAAGAGGTGAGRARAHGVGGKSAAARGRDRQARGLSAGHSAWARGLALGCALGALDLFLTRFDSVFSRVTK